MSDLFESAIGDIIDVIGAVGDIVMDDDGNGLEKLVQRKFGKGNPYRGSITSQANKLVMTFPVLMSNTINPTTALMISRAIERKMVVLLQMLFASAELVADGNEANVKDVIQKYYTGIDFKTMTVDDVVEVMERLDAMTESQRSALNGFVSSHINVLKEANLSALKMPAVVTTSLAEDTIGGMTVDGGKVGTLQEAGSNRKNSSWGKANSIARELTAIAGAMGYDMNAFMLDPKQLNSVTNAYNIIHRNDENGINKEKLDIEHAKLTLERDKFAHQKSEDKAKRKSQQIRDLAQMQQMLMSIKKDDRETYAAIMQAKSMENQIVSQRADFYRKQLLDSDVKKANEMVPSMLVVDFYIGTKGNPIKGTGIVGVKTRIIPVESAEIADRIASKNKAKAGLVNLIRATTGETKFMKDFVLNIDRAKVDAVARSKKGSVNPMWRVLERRANKQALRKALAQKNDASPITTLVITSEEVDYLRKMHAIDLNNVSIANDMLEAYNLMGLAIVDESAEVVKFLWDGEMTGFEPVSFLAMEKEDRDGGGMYKKVINLMAQNR